MRNFYRQGPPPVRPNPYYQGPGRAPGYGFPPPPPNRHNPGMYPPHGPGIGPVPGPGPGPKGSSKIESFMETCNRLLATAQGFQPYIAQASPLFRNIPALWRLYKGFSSSPKGKDDDDYDSDYESSEFSLDSSSSFEYVYKDDDHDEQTKHGSKNEHATDDKHRPRGKPIRHKYEYEQKANHHHKREGNRFFPPKQEKSAEQVAVEKIKKPYKTKPSVPRIYQPPYNFED